MEAGDEISTTDSGFLDCIKRNLKPKKKAPENPNSNQESNPLCDSCQKPVSKRHCCGDAEHVSDNSFVSDRTHLSGQLNPGNYDIICVFSLDLFLNRANTLLF